MAELTTPHIRGCLLNFSFSFFLLIKLEFETFLLIPSRSSSFWIWSFVFIWKPVLSRFRFLQGQLFKAVRWQKRGKIRSIQIKNKSTENTRGIQLSVSGCCFSGQPTSIIHFINLTIYTCSLNPRPSGIDIQRKKVVGKILNSDPFDNFIFLKNCPGHTKKFNNLIFCWYLQLFFYCFCIKPNLFLFSPLHSRRVDTLPKLKIWLPGSVNVNRAGMVFQTRPLSITVDRGSRGFGLSLIYRGLDKYDEKDTGIFVARVVPGGKWTSRHFHPFYT